MQKLRIQPRSNMYQPFGFSFVKEAQAPGIVNQWRQQLQSGKNSRTGGDLTPRQRKYFQTKLDAFDQQSSAAQSPAAQQQGMTPGAPAADGDPAVEGDPDVFGSGLIDDPAGATPAGIAATDNGAAQAVAQNPAQAIQTLMESVKQFGSQFNQEIRAYNQHIKQVHQSIAMLQKIDWNNSTVDLGTVTQQALALQKTLDTATVEQAKDMAFLQQLATQAAQLSQSAGGSGLTMEQSTAQPAAQPGMSEQAGRGVGQVAKAPGRALNWLGNQVGKGVDWAKQQGRQFGQGYANAKSDQIILTAQMGSAQSIVEKLNS